MTDSPKMLGKYRITAELGRGSFGVVYLAEDTTLRDRPVALKVLHPQLVVDPDTVGLFREEAGTMAHLEHTHIVTVYEAGDFQGIRFIAMRYVRGRTLARVIAEEGPQPLERVAGWLEQVAAALDYAHRQGVLHRDVKPGNILLDREDSAVVTDFGLAKAVSASGGSVSSRDRELLSGTARYMAPEQARGKPVPQSDVYSLGVVLYELLTGQVPFDGNDPFAIAIQHMTEEPTPPRALRPDLPEAVEAVVLRALAKEPAGRWQTAGEIARAFGLALEAQKRQTATAAQPHQRPKVASKKERSHAVGSPLRGKAFRFKQRLLIGVAAAIPIIVAVVVFVAWLQRGQAQRSAQEELWQQASGFWAQAQAEADVGMVRTHLANAQEKVEEYLVYQPESAEAMGLRSKIQVRLDEVNQVRRVTSVWRLNTYPADANLTRVVVQGAHILVMDRHGGHVYHHSMDAQVQHALDPTSTETILVSRGSTVGNVVVGELVDMVWMPTGHNRKKASLLILESGGTVLDYDPATRQLIPLRVASTEMWQYPRLLAAHSGRLYVLDSGANKIWRYDPTEDGYNSVPTDWLQIEMDLTSVVSMALSDSFYLLYADEAIRKFSIGEADTFDISDWDTPPSNPTSIFTRPPAETRWIYVADRGNSRIAQVSKEGQFAQQFRMDEASIAGSDDPLAGATDLFVDEITGRAYLLSGRDLYLLELPMSE